MMSRRSLSLLGLILLLAGMAAADSRARIVRLSYLQGDVQLDRGDGNGFSRAFLNMPLIEGTRVWTKADARAEIEFEDGSTLRLTPDSLVDFRELRLRNEGRSTMVSVEEGTAYFNIKRHREDDFRVLYQQQQISLLKSSRFRVGLFKEEMKVSVMNGEIEILKTDGVRLALRKNETLSIEFNDAERYYLAKGITEERHDYWDRERDQDRARYQREQDYGYSRAYSYGYHDLHRYGSFINISGYGHLWRPFSVSIGWDPFAAGHWVWYPGAGYVWVSPYDWGWTPYRYGSWVHVSRYGWCWRPTTVYNNWVTINHVVNAPRGYVPPSRPRDRVQHVVVVGYPDSLDRNVRTRNTLDGPAGGNGSQTIGSSGGRSERGSRDVITNESLNSGRTRTTVDRTGRTSEVVDDAKREDTPSVTRTRESSPQVRTINPVVDDAQREENSDTRVQRTREVTPVVRTPEVRDDVQREENRDVEMRRTRDVVPANRGEVVDDARREENQVVIPARNRATEEPARSRTVTPEIPREADARRPVEPPPPMQRPSRTVEPQQRMPEAPRSREPQYDRPARVSPPSQPAPQAPRATPPPPPAPSGAERTRSERGQ